MYNNIPYLNLKIMIAFILIELSISEKKKTQNVGNRFSDLKSKNFCGLAAHTAI